MILAHVNVRLDRIRSVNWLVQAQAMDPQHVTFVKNCLVDGRHHDRRKADYDVRDVYMYTHKWIKLEILGEQRRSDVYM